ncbi:hypothetical protein ACP4OV_010001 [Aristida adscensionis]
MIEMWSAEQWWEVWQLRVLVLGSLGIQWFLMLTAPMRKYNVRGLRSCIWLAYISSDALAIYALSTLFNRHVKAATSGSYGNTGGKGSILEVLWAPVLLIHLGGQEGWMAYDTKDNELWVRHTVTLVSQVSIVLYAFYMSWPSFSDWRLMASTIMLFIVGVVSLIEKPWALRTASNRMNKIYMILSDLSLSAAADELVQRGRIRRVQDVLRPLSIRSHNSEGMKQWLRVMFELIYTRAVVVSSLAYLAYHLLVAPTLYIGGLTLFATSAKHMYNHIDVKITYVLLCFTGALDVLELFIDKLLYRMMSRAGVPALCEMISCYNLIDKVSQRRQKHIRWLVKCAMSIGFNYFDDKASEKYTTYTRVSRMVLADLVDAQGRDLVSYRIFTVPDPSTRVPVDHDGITQLLPPSEVPMEVEQVGITQVGAGSPVKGHFLTMHDWPSSQEFGDHPPYSMEEIPQTSSHALRCQETTGDTGEIQIMISPDAESSFTNRWQSSAVGLGASDPDDEPDMSMFFTKNNIGRPAAPTARRHRAMEQQPIRFIRQESEKARANWALSKELQEACGPRIRDTLRGSFDRSVLVWHIATDLCFRLRGDPGKKDQECTESDDEMDEPLSLRMECTEAISDYMAHLLNFHPDMLLTGCRRHLATETMREIEAILDVKGVDHSGQPPSQEDLGKIIEEYSAWPRKKPLLIIHKNNNMGQAADKDVSLFHIPEACRLAKELLELDEETRWKVMYRVWLGMLFYSASMCRGHLHAKSLSEGGEFLSFVWLALSLMGAKTLADKLQMPKGDEEPTPYPGVTDSSLEKPPNQERFYMP